MAQYVVNSGEILVNREFLQQVIHTFLIRTPQKSVPSYYRMCTGSEADCTGFRYFNPGEAGYKELRILFDHIVREKIGDRPPVVVDSDDPEGMMRAYCEAVGVEFRKELVEWGARPVEEFQLWPGFHVDVENSTGLGIKNSMGSKKLVGGGEYQVAMAALMYTEELLDVAQVQDCIRRTLPDYNYLKKDMVEWEARPVMEFQLWLGFYVDVENNTGLGIKNKLAPKILVEEKMRW